MVSIVTDSSSGQSLLRIQPVSWFWETALKRIAQSNRKPSIFFCRKPRKRHLQTDSPERLLALRLRSLLQALARVLSLLQALARVLDTEEEGIMCQPEGSRLDLDGPGNTQLMRRERDGCHRGTEPGL